MPAVGEPRARRQVSVATLPGVVEVHRQHGEGSRITEGLLLDAQPVEEPRPADVVPRQPGLLRVAPGSLADDHDAGPRVCDVQAGSPAHGPTSCRRSLICLFASRSASDSPAERVELDELDRGDRDANRALYLIILSRLRDCPDTKAYAKRRQAEGLSKRELFAA